MVICKNSQCPYFEKYNNSGFCTKEFVCIDELGMCSVIWRKGNKNQLDVPFSSEKYLKMEMPPIIDVVFEEIKEGSENTESGSEDLLNGSTAHEQQIKEEEKKK